MQEGLQLVLTGWQAPHSLSSDFRCILMENGKALLGPLISGLILIRIGKLTVCPTYSSTHNIYVESIFIKWLLCIFTCPYFQLAFHGIIVIQIKQWFSLTSLSFLLLFFLSIFEEKYSRIQVFQDIKKELILNDYLSCEWFLLLISNFEEFSTTCPLYSTLLFNCYLIIFFTLVFIKAYFTSIPLNICSVKT